MTNTQMTQMEMHISLERFDECFMAQCKRAGLSLEETKKALLENENRKILIDSIVKAITCSPYVEVNMV